MWSKVVFFVFHNFSNRATKINMPTTSGKLWFKYMYLFLNCIPCSCTHTLLVFLWWQYTTMYFSFNSSTVCPLWQCSIIMCVFVCMYLQDLTRLYYTEHMMSYHHVLLHQNKPTLPSPWSYSTESSGVSLSGQQPASVYAWGDSNTSYTEELPHKTQWYAVQVVLVYLIVVPFPLPPLPPFFYLSLSLLPFSPPRLCPGLIRPRPLLQWIINY